jgi:hypothetical protein
LANHAAQAGWSDSEIAALFFEHRRRHGQDVGKALRPEYCRRTIETARKSRSAITAQGPYGLTLRLAGAPHKTSSRTTFSCRVLLNDECLSDITITTTSTGLEKAARYLVELLTEPPPEAKKQVTLWLSRTLITFADQSAKADRIQVPTGESSREAIQNYLVQECDFRFVNEQGQVWSEKRGGWFRRQDVIVSTPTLLMDRVRLCHDVPGNRDGQSVSDSVLVGHITKLLGVAWANLFRELPLEAAAVGLTADSHAASEFCKKMFTLWTTPKTWQILQHDPDTCDPGKITARSSLTSRAVQLFQANDRTPPRCWRRVHHALAAWWRIAPSPGSQRPRLWLAMRHELASQLRIELPGVVDQRSLCLLATRYGIAADENDPATPAAKLGRSGLRLLVLSPAFTDELTDEPGDEAPPAGGETSGSSSPEGGGRSLPPDQESSGDGMDEEFSGEEES